MNLSQTEEGIVKHLHEMGVDFANADEVVSHIKKQQANLGKMIESSRSNVMAALAWSNQASRLPTGLQILTEFYKTTGAGPIREAVQALAQTAADNVDATPQPEASVKIPFWKRLLRLA